MNELCAALTVGESAESHPAVALNPGWRFRRGLRKPQRPHWVANAEMLSLTARRRLVRTRTGRSRQDCPKSGMRHIAPGGRIDGRHADFGGPVHERSPRPPG